MDKTFNPKFSISSTLFNSKFSSSKSSINTSSSKEKKDKTFDPKFSISSALFNSEFSSSQSNIKPDINTGSSKEEYEDVVFYDGGDEIGWLKNTSKQ